MVGSEVFFAEIRASSRREGLLRKIERLFDRAGFPHLIKEGDAVAVKLHFGERGNTTYIRPILLRPIVRKIKDAGGKPFLTDTTTLYRGSRSNGVLHLLTALENGFDYSTVEAPIIIADGLRGKAFVEIEAEGKHLKKVRVAEAVYFADVLIGVSHVTGHPEAGLAGTIKNIAMGCATRGGKQMIHSSTIPSVNRDKCQKCGECIKWCPGEAIQMKEEGAYILKERCLGCGECVATCRYGAIAISWGGDIREMHEKMAEFFRAVVKDKKGKAGFFNFILNVTPHCDCQRWSDNSIIPDVGILASLDPVAIEQAALDLVNAQPGLRNSKLSKNFPPGTPKFKDLYPNVDETHQVQYLEELGLGKREYKLVKV